MKVSYRTNESYRKEDAVILDFDFDVNSQISDDKKSMEIELSTVIFKDAEKNNYPFEMFVSIKGFFYAEIEDDSIEFFKSNATAILFPNIRAIISTYTVNTNNTPVILPPMNINAYMKEKMKE